MRCHNVSIANFTIGFHINATYSQLVCINDFEFNRMEAILELHLQTMEDAFVFVKPNINGKNI